MTSRPLNAKDGFSIGTRDEFQILSGLGAPGSEAITQAAPESSWYVDRTNKQSYQKVTAGSGSDKWTFMGSSPWRLPSDVRDNTTYADIAAVKTAYDSADAADSVSLFDGFRVLLTDLTSGNENIYDITGSIGSWTITETGNAATLGDHTSILSGTDQGNIYTFDGAAWVLDTAATDAELGFIRAFIGKTGVGSESPTYSSTNQISQSTNLETAIGAIDAFLGPDVSTGAILTAGETVKQSLEALEAAIVTGGGTTIIVTGITTVQTVDSVLVDDVALIEWLIYIQGTAEADAVKKEAMKILVTHDGHLVGAAPDATVTDDSEFANLKLGSALTGLTVTIDLNGTGASQAVRLRVASTTSVDVHVVRNSVFFT